MSRGPCCRVPFLTLTAQVTANGLFYNNATWCGTSLRCD